MACRKARLMTCVDPWSFSAVVNAFAELVFSALVLLSSVLYFLTVAFGQTFNLHRPTFWDGRRSGRLGAGKREVTALCEHHAKQISALRSSVVGITAGMGSVCRLCELSLLYCSCKKQNLGTGTAGHHTQASSAEGGVEVGSQVRNSSTSRSWDFLNRGDADADDELVFGSMKTAIPGSTTRNNGGRVEFTVCPTCGLAVMAAGPYEKRSVKRKLAKIAADKGRGSRAERSSGWEEPPVAPLGRCESSLFGSDQPPRIPRQEDHRAATTVDGDQHRRYANERKGCLSRCVSLRGQVELAKETKAPLQEFESSSKFDDQATEEESTRHTMSSEGSLLSVLYRELEEERNSSATAASEAMAMITRLQEEKASIQMEARHFRRMVEEKAVHDQEAISALLDMIARKDDELVALTNELQIYRRKLLAANWSSDVGSPPGLDESGQSSRLQYQDMVISDRGILSGRSEVSAASADMGSTQVVVDTSTEVALENAAKRLQPMDRVEDKSANQGLAEETSVVKNASENLDPLEADGQRPLALRAAQESADILCSEGEGNGMPMEVPTDVTLAKKISSYVLSKEDSKALQNTNEILKSREKFLDALKSSAALSLLEEDRIVDRPSVLQDSRDVQAARNVVLEEHRLSVLEYVRKFEGQLGRKLVSQPSRGFPVAGSTRTSQTEQLLAKDEAREPVEPGISFFSFL